MSAAVRHLEDCLYLPITCPLGCLSLEEGERKGEVVKMERRLIPEHVRDSCPMREVVCEFCEGEVKAREMNPHLKDCVEFPLPCPNGCSREGEDGVRELKRKDIPVHLDNNCPLHKVQCSYWDHGCKEEMERRHTDTHEREFLHIHFKLSNIFTTDMNQKQNESIQHLQHELSIANDKVAILEKQIASLITTLLSPQTEAVIIERERIETQTEGLQIELKNGLSKLEQLRTEVQVVLDHESDIARNQDFTYKVNEEVIVKHDLEPNIYVTHCLICNMTCHKPCTLSNYDDKHRCSAMDGSGIKNAKCRVCIKGCHWKQHKNMQYYFTTETKAVVKTSDELKQRYQDANGKVQSAQQLVDGIVDEFEAVQVKVIGITDVLRRSIEKLNKIALKPISLSTSEYITILIQSEKMGAELGWQDRVQNLIGVKAKVDSMTQIAADGFDLFEGLKRRIAEDRQNKQGVRFTMGTYLEKIQFWSS